MSLIFFGMINICLLLLLLLLYCNKNILHLINLWIGIEKMPIFDYLKKKEKKEKLKTLLMCGNCNIITSGSNIW